MKVSLNIIVIFSWIFGCSFTFKEEIFNIESGDSVTNIFLNHKVHLDKYSIIRDPYKRKDFYIVKKANKYGIINDKKELVLPIEYEMIERPNLTSYFIITKNSLTGVVTTDGILTVPIYYEQIEREWKQSTISEKDCFIVQKNQKLGSIDFHNEIIIPIEFDGISNGVEYGPEAHYVKKGNRYGLVDYSNGKLIIPVIYDGIRDCGNILEVKKDNNYGIISWKNEEVIPCIYDNIFVDLEYFLNSKNHKDRIFAKLGEIWYEFLMNGTALRTDVSQNEFDRHFNVRKPETEYKYHLKDCMVFTK